MRNSHVGHRGDPFSLGSDVQVQGVLFGVSVLRDSGVIRDMHGHVNPVFRVVGFRVLKDSWHMLDRKTRLFVAGCVFKSDPDGTFLLQSPISLKTCSSQIWEKLLYG